MSKNYIEKIIEEKVSFEPDYSKIKEQVNIKPKKANKKRWIWPSLSIGLVSIVVIITIIVSLSLRSKPNPNSTPTPTYDGVHYNNYTSSSSNNGEPLPPPPMVRYSIDVEKDNYDYNEEFIIKYTIKDVGRFAYEVTDKTNLNVKIVSDKFEFLSPTEYHFDLDTDINIYGNILSFREEYEDSIYPIEMELKVKAKRPNERLDTIHMDSILFLYEFPLQEELKEWLSQEEHFDKGETYKNGADEFTKNLEWIHRFYYLNDDLGTFLVDENKRFEYPNPNSKWSDETITVPAKTEIMYRSLNRLYSNNLISENKYMKRLIDYFTGNMTYLGWEGTYIQDKHIVSYQYYSRNFRAYFDLNDEYDYLFELYQKDQESRIQVTKDLVRILYEQGKITLDEYNNEIAIIDEEGVLRDGSWQGDFWQFNKVFIPFENYENYHFDIYIEI